jgi:hypothetical protein
MKSDNQTDIGSHVFTKSGLGIGPFRCVGVFQKVGPIVMPDGTEIGSPGQAMGVCAHCGTGIADCYQIRSADGKQFVVGSSCVEKTGDAGLIKSYKNSPAVRALNATKRKALDERKSSELTELLAKHKDALSSKTVTRYNGEIESLYDSLVRAISYCGASGRARYLKHVKGLVSAGKLLSQESK